jgi:hypothetical protein
LGGWEDSSETTAYRGTRAMWETFCILLTPAQRRVDTRCDFQNRSTHRYWRFVTDRHHSTYPNGEQIAIASWDYQAISWISSRISWARSHGVCDGECDHIIRSISRIMHVIRHSNSTTKLCVVFNASCKTRNGISLNDQLLVGPKLQQDLPAIIVRWRQWRYVYTADIAKISRQLLVEPMDADFQRILWRPTPESSLQHYRLRTVTYGSRTISSEFLSNLRWWIPISGRSPDHWKLNLRWWYALRQGWYSRAAWSERPINPN